MSSNDSYSKIPLKTHVLISLLGVFWIPVFLYVSSFILLSPLCRILAKSSSYSQYGWCGLGVLLFPVGGLISWPFFVAISTILREVFGRKRWSTGKPLTHQLLVYGVSLLVSQPIAYFIIYFDILFARP